MSIRKSIIKKVYKKRDAWSSKYDFGHLLVIGGSNLYSGAPALNALAALRSGVDLVTVAAPKRAADIISSFSPDLITYPLEGDYIGTWHVKELLELAKNKNAVVIGGGIGRKESTFSAVRKFLTEIDLPTVVDADALHAITKKCVKEKFILSPHSREFHILSGMELKKDIESRKKSVKKVASRYKFTVLLKGHVDVISNGKKVEINKTGTPYMTKGGTGDTLAGIAGSLLAQDVDTFEAACAAAYINGKAGELASKEKKQGLLASDILDKIPRVI